MNILFVDDDSAIATAFSHSLQTIEASLDSALKLDIAESAEEALERLETTRYAIVISDQRMRGESGLALIERHRKMDKTAAHILISGLLHPDLPEDPAEGTSLVALLCKPWRRHQLQLAMAKAIAFHRRQVAKLAESGPDNDFAAALVIDPQGSAIAAQVAQRAQNGPMRIDHVLLLEEGLKLLAKRTYHMIFVALDLPDGPELEPVTRLRQAAPDTPLVVVAAPNRRRQAMESLTLGADDYILRDLDSNSALHRTLRHLTQRQRSRQRVGYLTSHDQLTGIWNRPSFLGHLTSTLANAGDNAQTVAVFSVDLDQFKKVNEELGQEVGDQVLRTIGGRLAALSEPFRFAARTGGDQFAVVARPVRSAEVAKLANELRLTLAEPIHTSSGELVAPTHIGAATYPAAGRTADEILGAADVAMSEAAQNNESVVVLLDKRRRQTGDARLETELREALEKGEFLLYYQPQFDLRTGDPVGAEALLRWRDKSGEIVPPGQFVPVMERGDLIVDVGAWVIQRACQQLVEWQRDFPGILRIAANLSARQFEHPGLLHAVEHALEQTSIDPASLELEITEGLLLKDTEHTQSILSTLRAWGVRIAIDDFGTGYSSLAYLHRFPVDTIKVDRSFIQALDMGGNGAALVSAIIGLAHKLEFEIVAEGVETAEQLQFLKNEGADLAQGFLLGRPSPDWTPSLSLST
ncbi:MAG: EAL domain-containing protein [Deltaproteobacteria bacterium]|nr:EAL domain-containing protein [Deltaproteobacteria bacterium]